MAISVVAPIAPAIEWTKQILFRPFRMDKWLSLGFCAWLATLGEGAGFGFGFRFPVNAGGPPAPQPGAAGPPAPQPGAGGPPLLPPRVLAPTVPPAIQEGLNWLQAHLTLVIGIGVALIVLAAVVFTLLDWIKHRARFLFLDGVVRDRGAIVEPWAEYRREGNSAFSFSILFGLVLTIAGLLTLLLGVGLALPDIRARSFGAGAIAALLISVPLLLFLGVSGWAVNVLFRDIVVPIMYLRRQAALPAWGTFRRELLAGREGTFALYLLFQVVIGIGLGILGTAITCATCCLAALPYLGAVFTLPLTVFSRSYSLLFLEQFGPEWLTISSARKPAPPVEDFDDPR